MMVEELQGKELEELPKTEVVAKAQRRRFTAEYKLRILREVEACQGSGEIGALRGAVFIESDQLASAAGKRRTGWTVSAQTWAEGGSAGGRTGKTEAGECAPARAAA
jgi:hypothetical protein